jgi:hypothetical protein
MFYVAFKCKLWTEDVNLNTNISNGNRLFIQVYPTSAFLTLMNISIGKVKR